MKKLPEDLAFEDSLSEDWNRDLQMVELRLEQRPTRLVGFFLTALILVIAGRIVYLNVFRGGFYELRAEANINRSEHIPAPRGIIEDRSGEVLAENQSVFRALLDVGEYSRHPELRDATLSAAQSILGISPETIQAEISAAAAAENSDPIVLAENIPQDQVVKLQALNLPTLSAVDAFMRYYPLGSSAASLVGYVTLPNAKDLAENPNLSNADLVGKAGLEMYYDSKLQGTPGIYVRLRNAQGQIISEQEQSVPKIGDTLHLTVDAGFQKYFSDRMIQGLQDLGRTSGAAIAMNPQNGQILALMSFPNYDPNVLSSPGHTADKLGILNSPLKPLFDRAVSGYYSPGSTIKPLDAVALLKENIIDPNRTIFSPGYLDVPNPYDPSKSTRFLDWRYQGEVNMYDGIAWSSDVYFYETVGGFGDIKGLGITKLRSWWQTFGLGRPTGIDVPGEGSGFLPSPDWKAKNSGEQWLLGDTYNVAIGQGDLTVTPIQLLNYISAIANGGTLYQPTVNLDNPQGVKLADLTYLAPQIKEVQKGMRLSVTSPQGTAYKLNDLPFPVYAKTGSAQINNNTKENAFFVGYAPDSSGNPAIAILILVEDSRQGSLNAVPIAKDVLQWYWQNRLSKQ